MKSLIATAALATVLLTSSQAGAWMHGGGYHHGGWGGYHHGWGHGYGYGHRWSMYGGACRMNCNPWGHCWRVCW